MKPHRVRMAHHLIVTYGLYKYLDVYRPPLISQADITKFHSDDYVNFLRMVTPDNMEQYVRQLQRCKFIFSPLEPSICPWKVFNMVYSYCGKLSFLDMISFAAHCFPSNLN